MSIERYFTDQRLEAGCSIMLEDEEQHHLIHVMRARIEDCVELVNGKRELATARLTKSDKRSAHLLIEAVHQEALQKQPIILALGLIRPSKLEWVIEKGTELGADGFWLFPARLSEKQDLSQQQLKRLHALSVAAMKQCGRLTLPQIEMRPCLEEWPELKHERLLFGDTRKEAQKLWDIKTQSGETDAGPIVFCVGPEKGFHAEEIEILEKRLLAKGVGLNTNVLRAETAPLAALSILAAIRSC